MSHNFQTSLTQLQRLDIHKEYLDAKGFHWLETREAADPNKPFKLHDLYDWIDEAWFECKTDGSSFTNRLLVEAYANVPNEMLAGIPTRTEIEYGLLASRLSALPPKYFALSTDKLNIETTHYLSYYFSKTKDHYVYDLHALRQQIAKGRYDWFVCGYEGESWKTVAQVVPLADCLACQTNSPPCKAA